MTFTEGIVVLLWGALVQGWIQYFIERKRSRDYATDLSQLIHDYDLGREDFRRSLKWEEIAERVDREGRR